MGGPDYIKKTSITLGINDVINNAAKAKSCKLFVLLAPRNYDFNDFLTKIEPHLVNDVRIEHVDPKAASHFLIGVQIQKGQARRNPGSY